MPEVETEASIQQVTAVETRGRSDSVDSFQRRVHLQLVRRNLID